MLTQTFKLISTGRATSFLCISGILFTQLKHNNLLYSTAIYFLPHLGSINPSIFMKPSFSPITRPPKWLLQHFITTSHSHLSLFFIFRVWSYSLAHISLWLPYFHPHHISGVQIPFPTTISCIGWLSQGLSVGWLQYQKH